MNDNRFQRTELLIGNDNLHRLRESFIVVAGLGAVGSYAVEGLARSGIGHFRLIDFDRVEPSNINRQLYALESTIGRMKTEVAAARVHAINPDADVETLPLRLCAGNLKEALASNRHGQSPAAVVDCIDDVHAKVALLEAAHGSPAVVVSSMGAARRISLNGIRIDDLSRTSHCPLAAQVRRRLAHLGIRTGIRCVYSTAPAAPITCSEKVDTQPPGLRTPFGSLSTVTGIFGLTAAHAALEGLLSTGSKP